MPTVRNVLAPSPVAAPGGNFALGIQTERFVFSGGQIGTDQETGRLAPTLDGQIRCAVKNLEEVLLAGGSGLEHIVKTTCFLSDIASFQEFNDVYGELIPTPFPARSTVGVQLAGELLFEIEAVALVKEENR